MSAPCQCLSRDRPIEQARRHAEAGAADVLTDDYAGSHWLSSFALYLLTRDEGGIAPGAG